MPCAGRHIIGHATRLVLTHGSKLLKFSLTHHLRISSNSDSVPFSGHMQCWCLQHTLIVHMHVS